MDNPFGATDPARTIYGDADRSFLNPSSLFVDSNYKLRFNAWCSVAGVTLALRYRFLRATDNEIVDSAEQLIPTSNRVLTTVDVSLAVGFLIDLNVFALAGTPAYGTTFAQVQLVRGSGAAATVVATLLQAYVNANQAKCWPGSAIESSLDGPGVLISVTGGVVGAGAELSETIPAGCRREPLSITCQLVASATVATRNTLWVFDDGANVYGRWPQNNNQTAGVTAQLSVGPGASFINGAPTQGLASSLPTGLKLAAGHRMRTSTVALQAGDQYSALQYLVREWLTAD